MKRFLIIGMVLVAAAVWIFVAAQLDNRRVFIAGDQPVNNEQVRQKLLADGWSDVQVSRHGRFIVAIASRNGQETKIEVEAMTGRIRITDDDEPVTAEDPD